MPNDLSSPIFWFQKLHESARPRDRRISHARNGHWKQLKTSVHRLRSLRTVHDRFCLKLCKIRRWSRNFSPFKTEKYRQEMKFKLLIWLVSFQKMKQDGKFWSIAMEIKWLHTLTIGIDGEVLKVVLKKWHQVFLHEKIKYEVWQEVCNIAYQDIWNFYKLSFPQRRKIRAVL